MPLSEVSTPFIVGESVRDPLQYYSNITVNTEHLLEAMHLGRVRRVSAELRT